MIRVCIRLGVAFLQDRCDVIEPRMFNMLNIVLATVGRIVRTLVRARLGRLMLCVLVVVIRSLAMRRVLWNGRFVVWIS